MENTNETMETMEEVTVMDEPETTEVLDCTSDDDGRSGNGLKIALALGGLVAAGVIAASKNLKSKKSDKPKKKRRHYKIVRVEEPDDEEDSTVIDLDDEDIETVEPDESEKEETEK